MAQLDLSKFKSVADRDQVIAVRKNFVIKKPVVADSDEDLKNSQKRIEDNLKDAKARLRKAKTPTQKKDAKSSVDYWTKAKSNPAAHM